MSELKDMVGKTFQKVVMKNKDALQFFIDESSGYALWHNQDCCECVEIEDVCGDLQDLVGSPILQAEESSKDASKDEMNDDSGTWTFYKFATIKGSVTVRWLGQSNGYYSESVDFDDFFDGNKVKSYYRNYEL